MQVKATIPLRVCTTMNETITTTSFHFFSMVLANISNLEMLRAKTRPLDDGHRIVIFLQRVYIVNDTSGFYAVVFRPGYLRDTTYAALFSLDLILAIFGVVGNAVTVFILAHRSLRSSTSMLLISMAMYDTVFLVTILAILLNEVSGIVFYTPTEATILNTLFETSGMASVYTAMAVTVERFIAVRKPMKARMFCTTSAAWRVISVVAAVSVILSIPRFVQLSWNNGSELATCAQFDKKSILHLFYCSLFPIMFILIIPFVVISILNACIYRGLVVRERNVMKLRGAVNYLKGDKLTCATLGTSSFFFICCTFPAVYITIDGLMPTASISQDDVIGDVCSTLVILNFSANFVFYCILGRAFRQILLKQLCCKIDRNLNNERCTLSYHRKRKSSDRNTSF